MRNFVKGLLEVETLFDNELFVWGNDDINKHIDLQFFLKI